MSEVSLGEEGVCFDDSWDVIHVDSDCYAHEEMLWSFGNDSIEFEQVGFFQCFEAKIVKFEITIVNQGGIECGAIFGVHDDIIHLL